MSALQKLVDRCNEMDITEQIQWIGDAMLPNMAQLELAALRAELEAANGRLAWMREALDGLFQACSNLPLSEMDRMENEINVASEALKE